LILCIFFDVNCAVVKI